MHLTSFFIELHINEKLMGTTFACNRFWLLHNLLDFAFAWEKLYG